MITFIEINNINSYKEQVKSLVRVADIVGIKQQHVEPTRLYDENGDVVSETAPTTKDFKILVVSQTHNDTTLHVDENEYNRIVAILTQTQE